MARYEVKLRNSGTYGIFTDGKGFVDIEEICDLLNAHDGMMTREQVEKMVWENFHLCNHFKDGEPEKRDAVERALKTVLNGGAK